MKFTLRIKKNKNIKYILKNGHYFKAKNLVVYIFENNKKTNFSNYLAICVNKKNGISVHRNKMKRWAREAYKYEEDKIKKGYNIVILYKSKVTIDQLNFFNVYEDIKRCFKGLNFYEN